MDSGCLCQIFTRGKAARDDQCFELKIHFSHKAPLKIKRPPHPRRDERPTLLRPTERSKLYFAYLTFGRFGQEICFRVLFSPELTRFTFQEKHFQNLTLPAALGERLLLSKNEAALRAPPPD